MYEEIKREIYANNSLSEYSNEELYKLINHVFLKQNKEKYFSIDERISIVDKIFSSIRGLGVLDELLQDDNISEIMINSFNDIYVEMFGKLIKSPTVFESEKDLEDMIQRMVGLSGREVNQANPIVDTRLPTGERVNIVLSPISIKGPVVTIRRFPKERITLEKLISLGTLTQESADFLKMLVKAKYNIFISGGTSSGKTTFLNALSDFIPKQERIITIEDSAELQITGINNIVRLETRNSNTSGNGEIAIKELIKTSLRMRPERIIVGEVRGAEALDMLNAMNTGHDGSLSTGHANSSYDMLSRLETMVLEGNPGLPLLAIRQHIASSLDILIHLGKSADSKRRVIEISELIGIRNGEIVLNPIYQFAHGKLRPTENKISNRYKLEKYGVKNEE